MIQGLNANCLQMLSSQQRTTTLQQLVLGMEQTVLDMMTQRLSSFPSSHFDQRFGPGSGHDHILGNVELELAKSYDKANHHSRELDILP